MTDLLEMINLGNRNVDRLSEPGELRAAAEQVSEIAHNHGAATLLAASSAAERIIGAVLVGHADLAHGLHTSTQPHPDSVLIVDINVASGTALARAARRARQSGAERVVAVVLYQLTMELPDPRTWDIDHLIVIDHEES
ncbi:hypothetical protein ABZ342_09805 [Amycolatopsis sp. NPDC005961]|uniref:hypothetical protein n=1 Tax=Amycolatopsis sp. NPDC005961 TaxID=3156720 RepID=UPI003405B92C